VERFRVSSILEFDEEFGVSGFTIPDTSGRWRRRALCGVRVVS